MLGMELIQLVGPFAPFERVDLACFLYDRIMNKNSYQLILNLFDENGERQNIKHRLGLDTATAASVSNNQPVSNQAANGNGVNHTFSSSSGLGASNKSITKLSNNGSSNNGNTNKESLTQIL